MGDLNTMFVNYFGQLKVSQLRNFSFSYVKIEIKESAISINCVIHSTPEELDLNFSIIGSVKYKILLFFVTILVFFIKLKTI